jgi:hypothetical protein
MGGSPGLELGGGASMTEDSLLRIVDAPADQVSMTCDIVVVGSGAAGASAAAVLAEAGLKVVIVEQGRHTPLAERREEMIYALRDRYVDFGGIVARGRGLIPILQGRGVGGTTVVNSGITWRMPETILRSWHQDAGLRDVLDWNRLQDSYDWLDVELGVRPVSEGSIGGNGGLMSEAARALGMTGRVIRRNERGCRGSGRCLQGCPHGAKLSMERSLLPRACRFGAIILSGARVEKILHKKGRAIGVQGQLCPGGSPFRVDARKGVVVAASATGSCNLLRKSGLRGREVGAHFQAHPGLAVAGVFPQKVNMWAGATQSWESAHHWNRGFKLESVGMPMSFALARLPGSGSTAAASIRQISNVAMWGVQIRARAEGRVRPGWGGAASIRYRLDKRDLAVALEGLGVLQEMFFAAGATEVWPGVFGLPERLKDAQHWSRLNVGRLDPRRFISRDTSSQRGSPFILMGE